MTVEKKAEAYDEAINQAKKELQTCGSLNCDAAKQIFRLFPELRESEDERIRKWLIHEIEAIYVTDGIVKNENADKALDWLEKQKEQFEDISTVLLVKKEIERRIETWQKSRKEALAMKCNTLADDAAVRIEELNSLISFLGTIRCNSKQKEQKPVDKFQEYLNASPAERRKMNMDEILGDNKGHQKKPDALTTDSNKEADTSDCKYKNLDDIAQEYVDGVKQYNPEPTWDLMQTAVCYGYHLAENKQKPAEWSEEDERMFDSVIWHLRNSVNNGNVKYTAGQLENWLKSLRSHWKPSEINPEEVRLLDTTISFLKDFADKGYENAVECIDWLKSKRNGTARK